jgi:hypothetical protein
VFGVAMTWDGRTLRAEITDADPLPPRYGDDPALDGISGRGLALVDHVARRWSSEQRHHGKIVWVELEAAAPTWTASSTPTRR